jgi:hypothetical protein
MRERITLPEDEKKLGQLRNKYYEYCARVNQESLDGKNGLGDSRLKKFVLEKLFLEGSVDFDETKEFLKRNFPESFNDFSYENAYEVVLDYVETGGRVNFGGTGLAR